MAPRTHPRPLALLAALILTALIGPAFALGATGTTSPAATAGGIPAPGSGTTPATATVTTTAAPSPAAATPTSTHTATARKRSSRLSDGALVAAILAGLIALGCLIWAVFRFGAFEPHWLLSLRHAIAEGGFRISATWAEFSDWIRLGH